MQDLQQLLTRTALSCDFDTFLKELAGNYPDIGEVVGFQPIMVGYEAANISLHTTKGKFVIKIFEANREPKNIASMLKVLIEAPKVGVSVPELIKGNQGYLNYSSQDQVPYYVTRFFEGRDFQFELPSDQDIKQMASMLSNLHTLNFPVVEEYDSWGSKNLITEFDKNKDRLDVDLKQIIEPVVTQMRSINWSSFSRSVIHGDWQLKHVLKNHQGKYCVLDFGCMSHDAKVVDVSVFLAWFCLHKNTWEQVNHIFTMVLDIYTHNHHLSKDELKALPIMIKAVYLAYMLKTSLLMKAGDTSEETKNWYTMAEENMKRTNALETVTGIWN